MKVPLSYMKHVIIALMLLMSGLILPDIVRAEYVLPYPSYMPGNKLYMISRLVDRAKQIFYFGNISSFKYHLALADKYLIEAKTLFEYKQYLLAVDALGRSDVHFRQLPAYLRSAEREKKDIGALSVLVQEAAQAHVHILASLKDLLPSEFVWRPEKAAEIVIPIGDMLGESIQIRRDLVNFH